MSAAPDVLGVIEGFYGPPWTWRERSRMLDFMADHGYGMYVYAPKDDPLHRSRWREPHFPEELDRFERLAARGRRQGIDVVFGIHPADVRHVDEADAARLYAKTRELQNVGVTSFCLVFDDLPLGSSRTDADRARLARHQAGLANGLHRRLAEAGACHRFIVTPTEYHGGGRSPYLETLGAELAPQLAVFWTGLDVCSATIAASDLRAISASLRRRPLIWDNYPVNDGEMRYDPHLGPYRGRSADLRHAVAGIVANPALEAEASKVALHTLATWWANPGAYDPERAWSAALRAVAGDAGDVSAVRVLADLARRSPIEPGAKHDSVPALDRFERAWSDASGEAARRRAIAEVGAEVAGWRRAAERLLGPMRNRALRVELERWSRKLRAWSAAGEAAISVLARAEAGAPPDGSGRAGALRASSIARRNPFRVADERIDAFIRRCLWLAAELEAAPTDATSRRPAEASA